MTYAVGPTHSAILEDAGAVDPVLAVAVSYEDLVKACVDRRKELGLSQMAVDEISGLQTGYVGKIEVGIKRLGA